MQFILFCRKKRKFGIELNLIRDLKNPEAVFSQNQEDAEKMERL